MKLNIILCWYIIYTKYIYTVPIIVSKGLTVECSGLFEERRAVSLLCIARTRTQSGQGG